MIRKYNFIAVEMFLKSICNSRRVIKLVDISNPNEKYFKNIAQKYCKRLYAQSTMK